MKIYTRTGDKGKTSLFSGKRVPKSDPIIEALGDVDTCNSSIGLALSFLPDQPALKSMREQLQTIQHALFDLGAALATPTNAQPDKIAKTRFDSEATTQLEHWMDELEVGLPELKTFILPGGHPAGASLHMARSLCRRAERSVAPLSADGIVPDNVMIFLNRLSDYLFMVSRAVNHQMQMPETLWKHHHA